tara:strand:+ start:109 stop:369 length:261 start_codon:yes stop_codon:yes gene_type:complete
MTNEYLDAPVHILDSINRYVEDGLEPGGFVKAVLSNDLVDALNKADTASLSGLKDILKYCIWKIPPECWGSRAKVDAWIICKRETV